MRVTRKELERKTAEWLRQGISPRRLAFTLAIGFVIGCVPVVGVTTVLCAGLALVLGLNLPAIQVANYAAVPFQIALVVPFLKLGSRVIALTRFAAGAPVSLPHFSGMQLLTHIGGLLGQAIVGWSMVALPAAIVLTTGLNLMLRRVPAVAKSRN